MGLDAFTGCGKLTFCKPQGAAMGFFITARDMAGSVILHRESVPAALKKADELLSLGFFNVQVVMPDGAAYPPNEFEQLRLRVGLIAGKEPNN